MGSPPTTWAGPAFSDHCLGLGVLEADVEFWGPEVYEGSTLWGKGKGGWGGGAVATVGALSVPGGAAGMPGPSEPSRSPQTRDAGEGRAWPPCGEDDQRWWQLACPQATGPAEAQASAAFWKESSLPSPRYGCRWVREKGSPGPPAMDGEVGLSVPDV